VEVGAHESKKILGHIIWLGFEDWALVVIYTCPSEMGFDDAHEGYEGRIGEESMILECGWE